MIERQKRLIEVYEHLRKYYGIHTKTGFSEALHYGRTSMSAAMNGDEKYLTDSLFKNICEAYRGVFNLDYLLTGEGQLLTIEEEVTNEELEKMVNPQQPAIPDYVQRLFDEAVRMSTRNELLERQCEKMISELRDSKDKNDTFLSELRKSKEYNDALVAELVISRKQNEVLITELRETRKENAALTSKLKTAIDGIESMKNQVSMLVSSYSVVAPPSPTFVNDMPDSIVPVIKFPIANVVTGSHANYVGVVPEGLIRGHQVVADEVVKKALKEMNKAKSKKKK